MWGLLSQKVKKLFHCNNCGYECKIYNPSSCPECKHILKYTGMSQDEWRSKTQEEKDSLKNKWKENLSNSATGINISKEDVAKRRLDYLLTSGYNFEGYKITSYNGIVSGEVVMGTGFLSELSASVNDFFGSTSENFSEKMKQTKEIATLKMIDSSIIKSGNAIIGVDFDYTTFGKNMIAVSANGTSVTIEKV